MKDFEHANVKTAGEAVKLLKERGGKARLIAGGTDLLGILKDRVLPEYPEIIINLKTVPNLAHIQEDSEGLKIGALARLSDIAESPLVREKCKVLAEAAESVATPLIRNLGTIGGNLCQEVRCWYYRYPHHIGGRVLCARKRAEQPMALRGDTVVEGKGCSALTGENRYHSLFGASKVGETPCANRCPAGIDIPAYMEKIRQKDLKGAAAKLLENNPMPGITGRVCPHPCQDACNRGDFDVEVSIRDVERFLGDIILDSPGKLMSSKGGKTGRRVAVVGAGPAGLSAAFFLRKSGHEVTVFDRMDEPGGMPAHAIPNFRLPGDVVRRLIKAYKKMGIQFRVKVDVGRDVTLQDLRKDFDALFLATGAWAAPSIGLGGEELSTPGLAFLAAAKRGKAEHPGKRVLVIGGGNVAVDVGITALRLGAEEVTLACLESREEMPALDWEIRKAIEGGVRLMTSWGPSRVSRSGEKALRVDLARCVSVFDDNGNFAPVCDEGRTETLEVDRVILAVGQRPELSYIKGRSRLKVERGLIDVDEQTQVTSLRGVYAGGDVTTGPATVVEALAAGRRAAVAMDRFLSGQNKKTGPEIVERIEPLLTFNGKMLEKMSPPPMPERPAPERGVEVEDELGLDADSAQREAGRCFNCGCVAVNASDMAPVLIALGATVKTTKRTVPAEEFFGRGSVNPSLVDPEEVITEVCVPPVSVKMKWSYEKFRLRKTVDFSIVSLASGYETAAGTFGRVRLVLGGVAPVPIRLREVEKFLKGKKAGKKAAEQAAAMAAEKAVPLAGNAYKLQIVKTMLKRSVMGAGKK